MLKNIFNAWIDVRKGERAKAFGMALFFFLAMATFWAMKPMKRGMIISYHKEHALEFFGVHLGGAQAEQLAKVVNVFAALALAMLLSYVSRRLAPRNIILLFCLLFTGAFFAYAEVIGKPGIITVWSFYVFGDMYNTLMLTLFWTLANDSVRPDAAKRLYGIIGLGGVLGGLVGATFVRSSVTTLGRESVLLMCILPTIAIALIGFLCARSAKPEPARSISSSDSTAGASGSTGSLFAGLRLLASSKYLLAICVMVAIYEVASSLVDFQLGATIERHVTDALERDRYFGLVAQAQSIAAIIVQLFFTSFVMRRFGVGTALLAMPVAILFGSVGFLLLPTLTFAMLMSVSDNSMNYSINQSAKETLYVPTSLEEKYQAKAFIDMFVQRFAKVIAVCLNLGLVALVSIDQVRWLSLASILMLVAWVGVIRFAGRRFEHLSSGAGAPLNNKAGNAARRRPQSLVGVSSLHQQYSN